MPIPRPSVEGILGEFRQQDYATVDGRLRTFVRTDRTLIRKTISFLCFKIEPTTMRSSFADMNMHNLRRWMKGRRRTCHLGARGTLHGFRRYTFARNDLLFTMSDNTRMQTTRERDALHARICFHGRATGVQRSKPLVEPDGIEPTTSCLQSRRSPN